MKANPQRTAAIQVLENKIKRLEDNIKFLQKGIPEGYTENEYGSTLGALRKARRITKAALSIIKNQNNAEENTHR